MDELILVDLNDNAVGHAPKLLTHEQGLLHRAFSLFIVSEGEMLIHRRAEGKYHSGGLWTNACCSHPRVGERLEDAVSRRAEQELGLRLDLCPPEVFSFVYRADFGNVCEYEYDHVFLAKFAAKPKINPNPEEMSEIAWVPYHVLSERLLSSPEQFTAWFITAAPAILKEVSASQHV